MDRAVNSLSMLGIVLALAGCGGGGGGGGQALELVEITSTNAKTVAGAAMVSSVEGGSFGAFALPGAAAFGATPTKTATLYAKVGSIQGEQTESLVKQSQAGYMQAALGPQTSACEVAGTATLSGNIANEQTLSAGDSLTMAFVGCDDGFTVVDGTLSMTITSFSGNLDTGAFSLGVTLELTDFEVVEDGEAVAADGDVTLTIDTQANPALTITVASNSLTVSEGGATHTLSHYALGQTVDGATGDYSIESEGTVASTAFAGAATFETVTPFAGTGVSYPASGQLLITGAGGATIRATVLDTTFVRLEIDTNGDGTVDETTDATWEELA